MSGMVALNRYPTYPGFVWLLTVSDFFFLLDRQQH